MTRSEPTPDSAKRPSAQPYATAPADICAFESGDFVSCARTTLSHGHGIAKAIYKDVLRRARFVPEEHGLRPDAAAAWRQHFRLALPEVVRVASENAESGTVAKAVLRLGDGLECECVMLPMGRGRHTLCISSQVGCKMGCRFCETGRMGLLRHMTTAEIIGELLVARHRLGWDFRNVVFMGMGEALDNSEAVLPALRVMTDPMGLGLSQERITVCTVGHLEGIAKLQALGMKRLNLSLSLNAANDRLRTELMPITKRAPLAQLQAALQAHRPRPNFVLGVNYCLMPGVNDREEHAREVAEFCRPIGRVMVNVIPYNPGSAPITRAPREDEVGRFIGQLRDQGLPVRLRITKGRSVMAACGQLGNVQLRLSRRSRAAAGSAEPS